MFILKHDLGETKDITLRGVNKELYDQFTTLSKKSGTSVGHFFSSILEGFIRNPWRLHGLRRFGHGHVYGKKPEKISDLDKLIVTKKDLVAAGETTMFRFSNINELIFDSDIDAVTMVKHVKMIRHCNITFRGKMPQLIQLAFTRPIREYNHPTNKEQLKDITIRKVSVDLYDEFLSKAKTEGLTTGECFSKIISNVLPFFEIVEVLFELGDREVLVISNQKSLTVTKSDLAILGERGVIFYNVENLEFTSDIDQELFLKTIIKIMKCTKVKLPTNIPRLIVLSRAIQCKETNLT